MKYVLGILLLFGIVFSWTSKTASYVNTPNGYAAAPRGWGAAVYDLGNNRIINFDGINGPDRTYSRYSNCLWRYHTAKNEIEPVYMGSWAMFDSTCAVLKTWGSCFQMIPSRSDTTPTDRHPYSHMVYVHENKSIYLYGGAGYYAPGIFRGEPGAEPGHPTDTWRFDCTEEKWYNISHFYDGKGGQINPGKRLEGGMAYDNNDAHLVFYGGQSSGTSKNDTWLYNIITERWRQVYPQNNPGSLTKHVMTSDVRRGCVYLYNGSSIWKYNVSEGNWINLNASGSGGSRNKPMCYDVNHDIVLKADGHMYNPKTNSWSSAGSGSASDAEFSNMGYDIITNTFVVASANTVRTFKYGADIVDTAGIYQYDTYTTSTPTYVKDNGAGNPDPLRVSPNPFNPETHLKFSLKKKGRVNLKIFDARGRSVVTLLKGDILSKGKHSIRWQSTNLTSGLYIAKIQIENTLYSKALVFLK